MLAYFMKNEQGMHHFITAHWNKKIKHRDRGEYAVIKDVTKFCH